MVSVNARACVCICPRLSAYWQIWGTMSKSTQWLVCPIGAKSKLCVLLELQIGHIFADTSTNTSLTRCRLASWPEQL